MKSLPTPIQRLITGACYLITLVAFYVLKVLLKLDFFFDVPIYAFSLFGTYEMLHAFDFKANADRESGIEPSTRITRAQKIAVWAYAIIFTPAYVLTETFLSFGLQSIFICFIGVSLVLVLLLVIQYEGVTLGGTGCAILTCFYPTVVLGFLLMTNHLPSYSAFAVLLVFVASPCSDCFAYLFGKYLGKFFPKKMAPTISPKKTMIGGLGGLFGGGVGAVVYLLIYRLIVGSFSLVSSSLAIDLAVVFVIGVVAAFMTEIGDLVESCIKRKAGIKDMGRLLPGHGGILDRIDGTMFTAMFVYIVFVIIIYFA